MESAMGQEVPKGGEPKSDAAIVADILTKECPSSTFLHWLCCFGWCHLMLLVTSAQYGHVPSYEHGVIILSYWLCYIGWCILWTYGVMILLGLDYWNPGELYYYYHHYILMCWLTAKLPMYFCFWDTVGCCWSHFNKGWIEKINCVSGLDRFKAKYIFIWKKIKMFLLGR